MDAGIIENCGKYSRIAPAGCVCIACPFENIVSRISLKVKQLDVHCDTKTKDNVFVKVVTSGFIHWNKYFCKFYFLVFISYKIKYCTKS